jgi:hypothetical protein
MLEGCLPDQKSSALLLLMDLVKGNGPRALMMGLLQATSGSFFEATIFGVVCTKCVTKVNERGSSLFPPSVRAISNHWSKHGCTGRNPDSKEVNKSLETDLINKRISAYSDPTRVAKNAAVHFPVNSNKKDEFICNCENCLFHAKTWRDFCKHASKQNKLNYNIPDKKPNRHQMVEGKYGVAIPVEMLNCIKNGQHLEKR